MGWGLRTFAVVRVACVVVGLIAPRAALAAEVGLPPAAPTPLTLLQPAHQSPQASRPVHSSEPVRSKPWTLVPGSPVEPAASPPAPVPALPAAPAVQTAPAVLPGPVLPASMGEAYPLVEVAPPLPPAPPRAARGSVGTQAPAFSLATPQGQSVALPEAAGGQPAVLLFWPSWCPYTRALQPYLQLIWEDYRPQGVHLWGINIEETRDPVQVMQERQLSFPVLVSGNAAADAFNVTLMPAVLVLDGQGQITYRMEDKTTSPIEAAKQIRTTLNTLIGEKAVALPTDYPKPYDLHLLALQGLNLKLAPTPLPQSEWEPWVDAYLATLKPDEKVEGHAAAGPLPTGKQAIGVAREVWSKKYGSEQALIQAPYRSYRINNYWVVLASGESGPSAKLGEGFIAVLSVDKGELLRVAPQQ